MSELRPYEPLGMTTAKWRSVRPRWVRIGRLVYSQEVVSLAGLHDAVSGAPSHCGDPYPHVVGYHGRLYLSDGHHRVAVRLCRRRRWVRARVLWV